MNKKIRQFRKELDELKELVKQIASEPKRDIEDIISKLHDVWEVVKEEYSRNNVIMAGRIVVSKMPRLIRSLINAIQRYVRESDIEDWYTKLDALIGIANDDLRRILETYIERDLRTLIMYRDKARIAEVLRDIGREMDIIERDLIRYVGIRDEGYEWEIE